MYGILQPQLLRRGSILIGLVIAIGAILLTMGGPVSAAKRKVAAPLPLSATNYPILFIHGVSLDHSATDCGSTWNAAKNLLQGATNPSFTGPMITVGYYTGDTNCVDGQGNPVNLSTPGPNSPRSHCYGYDSTDSDQTPDSNVGTNDESIRHIACELAWYIYDTYSRYGTNVQIAAFSMGGLITRYTLYAIHDPAQSLYFPPTLYVSDVLDFDTPNNGGIFSASTRHTTNSDHPCFTLIPPHVCLEAQQLLAINDFMRQLRTYAQNPQGSGWGTQWTLLGSSVLQGISCDLIVHPESALYMDSGFKIVYVSPCYGHGDMMQDNASSNDATVYYCHNCTKEDALNWHNWSSSSTYPHALRILFRAFYHPLPSGAIVSLVTNGQDACLANPLPANDDNSSNAVSLPFTANFFGFTYNSAYINNNGYITFDTPLRTYTPFPLTSTSHAIIASFFADVDTRDPHSNLVTYGSGTYSGHPTFCVDWVNVGYYNQHTDKINSFQLLLVDRSDRRAGDFDIIMNYNQIQWETGDASGGFDGFGGTSARVGYSNGQGTSLELPGSGVNGAFLDVNLGLVFSSQNSTQFNTQLGRYVYQVHNTGSAVPGKHSAPPPNPKRKPTS